MPVSCSYTLVQVLLRLQWERQVVRGQSMHMDASLDGVGVSVMGGLQDELFNLTLDRIQVPHSAAWDPGDT